jgi:predicted  nucleic acid-binding Zn-ribbon protein
LNQLEEVEQTKLDIGVTKTVRTVEEALKALWDKIRLTGELINQLKYEKKVLQERTQEFERENSALKSRLNSSEQEVQRLRIDVANGEQELKRLKTELAHRANTNGNVSFTPEEKEILKDKIRELIAKINSHL